MIDWWSVFKNGFWICGAALALAALSLGYYHSKIAGIKLRNILNRSDYSAVLYAAGACFALGMGLAAVWWWITGLWIMLVGVFGWQIYQLKIEN